LEHVSVLVKCEHAGRGRQGAHAMVQRSHTHTHVHWTGDNAIHCNCNCAVEVWRDLVVVMDWREIKSALLCSLLNTFFFTLTPFPSPSPSPLTTTHIPIDIPPCTSAHSTMKFAPSLALALVALVSTCSVVSAAPPASAPHWTVSTLSPSLCNRQRKTVLVDHAL